MSIHMMSVVRFLPDFWRDKCTQMRKAYVLKLGSGGEDGNYYL
jgi:hypothetical protein